MPTDDTIGLSVKEMMVQEVSEAERIVTVPLDGVSALPSHQPADEKEGEVEMLALPVLEKESITGSAQSKNRYVILASTALIQLNLGTLYTWSIFNKPLATHHNWSVHETGITFGVACLFVSLGTLFSGHLQTITDVRWIISAAAVVFGIGIAVSGVVNDVFLLYFTMGIMSGASNGLMYLTTLTNSVRWFPERRGLISGVVILFYGLGAIAGKYTLQAFLDAHSIAATFACWGSFSGLIVLLVAQLQCSAPPSPPAPAGKFDYQWKELFYAPQAYMLFWIIFSICMGGCYAVAVASNAAQDLVHASITSASNVVVIVAVANTSGRIVEGFLSDYIPRLAMLAFNIAIVILCSTWILFGYLNLSTFCVALSAIAFCFGGNLTVYPPLVGELFGQVHMAKNYSVIYQGFGISALIATITSTIFSAYDAAFYLILACGVVALGLNVLLFIYPPPPPRRSEGKKYSTILQPTLEEDRISSKEDLENGGEQSVSTIDQSIA